MLENAVSSIREQNSNSDHFARPGDRRIPYAWSLVLWLWCAHFLNQADRQVYGVVLPQLSADLHLSAVQAGLVAGLFTIALGICVPVAGSAGDRFDRKRIIVISLAAWSISTVLSGLASGLVSLVLVRSLASAAGEAFYTPAAYALIGQYHSATRARAMAVHQTALYAGIISSGLIAGWIADCFGWRYAFLIFGGAGLLLAASLQAHLRPAPLTSVRRQPDVREIVPLLSATPSIWWLSAAFGCLVFVNVGYLTWMPTYLHEHFRLSLASAGWTGMFWHHSAALTGVFIGGWASDRFARALPRRRVDIQALGLPCGAPFLYLLGSSRALNGVILALIGFGLFRGLYDSNIYPSLFEMVPRQYHSTVTGLVIACAFLFGALAPVLLGLVKQTIGLAAGFGLLGGVFVAGAVCLMITSRWFFEADYRRTRDTEHQITPIL